jgi:hypothetical protein
MMTICGNMSTAGAYEAANLQNHILQEVSSPRSGAPGSLDSLGSLGSLGRQVTGKVCHLNDTELSQQEPAIGRRG